uniref:Uncharacterized protein n=1 Tax=Eutreptiella gymnastica TaxID=73025 RepID=A0A7S4L9U1_9EUGL
MPHLPAHKARVVTLECAWLTLYASWDGQQCSSFHVTHADPQIEWCGNWSDDWRVLQRVASLPPTGKCGREGLAGSCFIMLFVFLVLVFCIVAMTFEMMMLPSILRIKVTLPCLPQTFLRQAPRTACGS